MKRFDEYVSLTTCLYGDSAIRTDLLMNPKMKIESVEQGMESLQFVLPLLEFTDYTSLDGLKNPIIDAIKLAERKNGQILWPLRVALSGEEFSPGAFELAYILGRDETLRRVHRMIAL
jgi:nondiscriminating glutamyl-tRNA synthetase